MCDNSTRAPPAQKESTRMTQICLTVSCPSTRGIVGAIGTFLAENGCNITDSSQFDDTESGRFFMRTIFVSEDGATAEALSESFAGIAGDFDMDFAFHGTDVKMKVIIMVSRFGHCLNDLLYRWRIGALPIDIVAVISNHMEYQKVVVNHDLPFHCIKVTKENKPKAEAQIMEIVEETEADLIVLARYMQVLSDEMCRKMSGRIINIHHSFLPSFKGAKPYHQAHERGVKLIGATAHYVTPDLDEGPIIEQETERVDHRATVDEFIAIGRDIEAQVLARAVRWIAERRVLRNGARTVVFR